MHKCAICRQKIEKKFEKLKGTVIKVIEKSVNNLIYVCSECQKKENWIEIAKIKSA